MLSAQSLQREFVRQLTGQVRRHIRQYEVLLEVGSAPRGQQRGVVAGADEQRPAAQLLTEGAKSVDEVVDRVAAVRLPQDLAVDVPRSRNRTVGFGHHRVDRHTGAAQSAEHAEATVLQRELGHPEHDGG